MVVIKSKDAKNLIEFNISTHTKGFIAESVINGNTIKEYFQFKEIYKLIHHPGIGIEIVGYNKLRRVFYNSETGKSLELYNAIDVTISAWMDSNLN